MVFSKFSRRFVVPCVALGVALVAGTAFAATRTHKIRFKGNASPKVVSGQDGTDSRLLGEGEGDYRAVTKIEWWEYHDKPCQISVTTRHMNNGTTRVETLKLPGCDNPGNRKEIAAPSKAAGLKYVAACLTDKNAKKDNRLKGLYAKWESIQDEPGTIAPAETGFLSAEHTNCANSESWETSLCNQGTLVSKVRVYWRADRGSFMGISAECRTLESFE